MANINIKEATTTQRRWGKYVIPYPLAKITNL